jgi:hypothetical protein
MRQGLNLYPPKRDPLLARSHDGLTLQEILVEIMEKFPKYDLSTDVSAFEAITSIEERLAEVAEFYEIVEEELKQQRGKDGHEN